MQYICDQGFVLTGSAILTCHDRQASSPKWSDRAPKCLRKCQMGRREASDRRKKDAASAGRGTLTRLRLICSGTAQAMP